MTFTTSVSAIPCGETHETREPVMGNHEPENRDFVC